MVGNSNYAEVKVFEFNFYFQTKIINFETVCIKALLGIKGLEAIFTEKALAKPLKALPKVFFLLPHVAVESRR